MSSATFCGLLSKIANTFPLCTFITTCSLASRYLWQIPLPAWAMRGQCCHRAGFPAVCSLTPLAAQLSAISLKCWSGVRAGISTAAVGEVRIWKSEAHPEGTADGAHKMSLLLFQHKDRCPRRHVRCRAHAVTAPAGRWVCLCVGVCGNARGICSCI